MRRWARIAAGMVMVIAGLVGLALPILPGWIWLIPGLMVLAREFTWARRLLDWLKARLPQKFRSGQGNETVPLSASATTPEQSDSNCRET